MWNSLFSAPEIIGGLSRGSLFWRGVLVFLLGLLFVLKPLLTVLTLAAILGWGFFFGGIWIVVSAFLLERRRIAWCIYGSLFFVLGALLLMNPMVEVLALAWSTATLFISAGIIGITVCLAAGNASTRVLLHFFTSVLSILLGCMLFVWPLLGLSNLIWVVGVLLEAEGVVLMVLAFRIPCQQNNESDDSSDPADPSPPQD
ncbi:MAG: acid-resistance membrane protein [Lentisphaerae bacterium ADurb.Bin242]|nr:MAG: acid-resistance membrane protein [Lentisphaerae bacterium ADurb.Bin242]